MARDDGMALHRFARSIEVGGSAGLPRPAVPRCAVVATISLPILAALLCGTCTTSRYNLSILLALFMPA